MPQFATANNAHLEMPYDCKSSKKFHLAFLLVTTYLCICAVIQVKASKGLPCPGLLDLCKGIGLDFLERESGLIKASSNIGHQKHRKNS
jgi:hypothetical protein